MSLSQLELQRQARIQANQARLAEIGLDQAVKLVAASQADAFRARRKPAAPRASGAAARRAAGVLPAGRVRRSERVAGIDAPNYNENVRLLSLADTDAGSRDRRLLRENVREEVYDVGHLDVLGSHAKEWELFVDGYDAAGNRVYDKVNGLTCHQCRQKTLGKRTACSGCQSLQGVLCGDCLFMRYGENVEEAAANPDWLCPLCRDICNCSFHRSKRGWAPTGTLYRRAIADGYTSVAHYLVLNNLSDEAKPVALQRGLCPPELAAELGKEVRAAAGAGSKQQAAAAVPAPAAQQPESVAVQEQLLQPEAAAPAGAPAVRRSGRASAAGSAAPEVAPQVAPKQKRQGTIQLAGAVNKVRGAAAAPKAAGAAAATTRRGLRSTAS